MCKYILILLIALAVTVSGDIRTPISGGNGGADADSLKGVPLQDTTGNLSDNDVPTYDLGTNTWNYEAPPGASGGEANTASNKGTTADSVFYQKTAVDLEFRRLIGAGTVVIAASGDTALTITGSAHTISWDWSDSSSRGPDSVLFADSSNHADASTLSDSTSAGALSDMAGDTDDISEGSSNLYNKDIKADTAGDGTNVATVTQPMILQEGTNITLTVINGDTINIAGPAGGGEANTLADTGTFNGTEGFGLAGGKTGTALKVKGLIEGTGTVIAASGDSAYSIAPTLGTAVDGSELDTGLKDSITTGFDHAGDNTQAHSDYMRNIGDTVTGIYNFSDNPLEAITIIDFDDDMGAPAHQEGRIFYDPIDNTLSVYNNESDITLNVGQEMWVYVRNISGSTILDGKVVYITGAVSSRPTIELAQADVEATCKLIGVATHDIETASNGYVTLAGTVHGINLSDFSDGDEVFLSAAVAGSLTATAPTAPNCVVEVGHIIDGSANGDLLVLTGKFKTLNMLSDVLISGSPPSAGDVLVYDGTVWADSGSVPIADSSGITGDVPSGVVLLNEVGNPSANKTFGMGDYGLTFNFASPSSNGMDLNFTGAFTGDGLHIHQHTGNPSLEHLVHIEAVDTDIIPLCVTHEGPSDTVAIFKGGLSQFDSVDVNGELRVDANFVMGSADISETEMEILDGATITTTELNYLANASSEIQTQLDGKEGTLTDKASLESTISDVADFAEADGDIYAGVHDFGGATSLEIPNSDNPTTDANGEFAADNNANAHEVYIPSEGESGLLPFYKYKAVGIPLPDSVQAYIPDYKMFRVKDIWAPYGIEIDSIEIQLDADAAYSLVVEEWSGADPPVFQSTITTIATGGTDTHAIEAPDSDAAIDANDWIVLDLPTTDVPFLNVGIYYHITEGN